MVILERGFDTEEPSIEFFNHKRASSFEALYYSFQINSRKLLLVDNRPFELISEAENFVLTY